ncbi:MAG: Wadjet anti-phage system protein JetD domain-containing protein [Cytobacillus gottheilii]|uniref:Wadjet anti-phage system protein JetD domain-containing protein n=1 Tax=Cytobacillus gottheilii TaxID=859144 RepID=UPI00082F423A|nr:Wadjet anti-phage system protein JetD domain-containing protein [Cytobacillus gottheilii]
MKEWITKELLSYSKKTIVVEELERWVPSGLTYEQFAEQVLLLENEGILEMVKAKGRNSRTPSLAYSYRIHTIHLKKDYHEQLKTYRLKLHPSISLDSYYRLQPAKWNMDLPFLLSIHQYLESFGLPIYEVPAPERSVELVGDEKWITDKQGKELLERVGLWNSMKIIPVSDPLMFALNPKMFMQKEHKHLIVENKTTYQGLLDALPHTSFTTLIYGCGNKILNSMDQFERQLPLEGAKHRFYYFGDLDRSGIFIWHRLQSKIDAEPAMPFYEACLAKEHLQGKTNQRLDEDAVAAFSAFLKKEQREQLHSLLDSGCYFPQEVLKTEELQTIWRQTRWS